MEDITREMGRRMDGVKMDLKVGTCENVDRIRLAQDKVFCEHGNELSGSIN
jgi:hypothetical protein